MVACAWIVEYPHKVGAAPRTAVEPSDLACVTSLERAYLSDEVDTFVFQCWKTPLDVSFLIPSDDVPSEVGKFLRSKAARARAKMRGGEAVGCVHEERLSLVSGGNLSYVHFCFLH